MMLFGRPYFAGACIVTRKDMFTRINGFDETIPLAEDVDFAFRMRVHGECGFLSTEVSTSMRRLEKIGLREFWEYAKAVPVYMRTGRVPDEMISHYTFGDH